MDFSEQVDDDSMSDSEHPIINIYSSSYQQYYLNQNAKLGKIPLTETRDTENNIQSVETDSIQQPLDGIKPQTVNLYQDQNFMKSPRNGTSDSQNEKVNEENFDIISLSSIDRGQASMAQMDQSNHFLASNNSFMNLFPDGNSRLSFGNSPKAAAKLLKRNSQIINPFRQGVSNFLQSPCSIKAHLDFFSVNQLEGFSSAVSRDQVTLRAKKQTDSETVKKQREEFIQKIGQLCLKRVEREHNHKSFSDRSSINQKYHEEEQLRATQNNDDCFHAQNLPTQPDENDEKVETKQQTIEPEKQKKKIIVSSTQKVLKPQTPYSPSYLKPTINSAFKYSFPSVHSSQPTNQPQVSSSQPPITESKAINFQTKTSSSKLSKKSQHQITKPPASPTFRRNKGKKSTTLMRQQSFQKNVIEELSVEQDEERKKDSSKENSTSNLLQKAATSQNKRKESSEFHHPTNGNSKPNTPQSDQLKRRILEIFLPSENQSKNTAPNALKRHSLRVPNSTLDFNDFSSNSNKNTQREKEDERRFSFAQNLLNVQHNLNSHFESMLAVNNQKKDGQNAKINEAKKSIPGKPSSREHQHKDEIQKNSIHQAEKRDSLKGGTKHLYLNLNTLQNMSGGTLLKSPIANNVKVSPIQSKNISEINLFNSESEKKTDKIIKPKEQLGYAQVHGQEFSQKVNITAVPQQNFLF